jgi:hypothetical protein
MDARVLVIGRTATPVIGVDFIAGFVGPILMTSVQTCNAGGKSNVTISAVYTDKTSEKSMDGTVVRVGGDKLTMTNKQGKEHSHALCGLRA